MVVWAVKSDADFSPLLALTYGVRISPITEHQP